MIFAGIVDVMLPDHLSSSNQKRFLGAIVARGLGMVSVALNR